jgi:16S rRNA (guanine966-N2)-methyltransferase
MVVATSAQDYLRGPAQPFDVVFLDPPFALDLWSALAQQLEAGGWLAPTALIYVESPRAAVPVLPAQWQVHREAVAGAVRYALYRHVPAGS